MKHRLKRWGISLGAIALLAAVIAVLLHHWLNTASTGTVHVGTASSQAEPTAQPLTITTPYFTAVLPAGFNLKRQAASPDNPSALVQLVADTSTTQDEQLAATVGTLPAGGLSGVGDYNLRATNTTTYTPFTPANLPAGASAFRNTTGPAAFTVFWLHGGRYVELALSTDGGGDEAALQSTFTQLMTSWSWQ